LGRFRAAQRKAALWACNPRDMVARPRRLTGNRKPRSLFKVIAAEA